MESICLSFIFPRIYSWNHLPITILYFRATIFLQFVLSISDISNYIYMLIIWFLYVSNLHLLYNQLPNPLPTTKTYFLHYHPSTNYPHLFSPQSASQSVYELPISVFSTIIFPIPLPTTHTYLLHNYLSTKYPNRFSAKSVSQSIYQLRKPIFPTVNLPIHLPTTQTYFPYNQPPNPSSF